MPEMIQQGLWTDSTDGKTLLGSCCRDCGAKAFPPRRVCPKCCSKEQGEIPLSRHGKVFSYTCISIKTPAVEEAPYLVGYVLLDDGITVPARLKYFNDDLDVGSRAVLEIGVTGKTAAGKALSGYYFRPEQGGEEI